MFHYFSNFICQHAAAAASIFEEKLCGELNCQCHQSMSVYIAFIYSFRQSQLENEPSTWRRDQFSQHEGSDRDLPLK